MLNFNMNSSLPPTFVTHFIPPVLGHLGELSNLGHEIIKATTFILIPTELLYFSIYFHVKGAYRIYKLLTFFSLVTLWISPYVAPISCGVIRCLQNFAIAITTMKLLDIFARRHSLPIYTAGPKPSSWLLSLLLMTELRYESFTPNNIRVPRNKENFNEPMQLAIHILVFVFLQFLPQNIPTIQAFEIQLAIYIIWTCMQICLRYKSSPALFGPLYTADSLTGFWSETWHNAFASPCLSLAYAPLRYGLPRYGVPVIIARSLGALGAFGLMAIFHIYSLSPILTNQELKRVGMFFLFNGIATVAEAMVWGKKRHWVKAVLAWVFETSMATWAASGIYVPNGLGKVPWREVCRA